MAPALVVLAGVEDAAVARPESHYYFRSNSQHSYHINFSLVSTCLKVKLLRKTMSWFASERNDFRFCVGYLFGAYLCALGGTAMWLKVAHMIRRETTPCLRVFEACGLWERAIGRIYVEPPTPDKISQITVCQDCYVMKTTITDVVWFVFHKNSM